MSQETKLGHYRHSCNMHKRDRSLEEFRRLLFGNSPDSEFFVEYAMRTRSTGYQFTGKRRVHPPQLRTPVKKVIGT